MDKTVTRGRRGGLTLFSLVAAVAGIILIVVAVRAQVSAPQPPRSVGNINSDTSSPSPSSSSSPSAAPIKGSTGKAPLGASKPVTVSIPAIGVKTPVLPIGLASDGTLQVPQPGPNLNKAAWFKNSPTPGQPGPSIIEGHVDSTQGPSVFFKLGNIRPGNKIFVKRADGVTAVFTVNAVRDFKKASFPTDIVYGAEDLSQPLLRVITCSDFDAAISHHVGNEVVFAHLTGTLHAKHAGKN